MKRIFQIALIAVAITLGIYGCKQNQETKEAKEAIDVAIEQTGEAVKATADELSKSVDSTLNSNIDSVKLKIKNDVEQKIKDKIKEKL